MSLSQDRDMYMLITVEPSLSLYWGYPNDPNGVKIFDSDGITLLFRVNGPPGGDQTSVTVGPFNLKAGNYRVQVNRAGGNGNYTLESYFSQTQHANDQEPNDGIQSIN